MKTWQLYQLQTLSLRAKVDRSKRKIREFYGYYDGNIYVSISGRDSAVLLDLVRSLFPRTVGVYCDTGLEYPEVRDYIKGLANIVWLRPKMTFKAVVEKYGFPVVSKEVSQKIYEVRRTKSDKLRRIRMEGQGNKWKSGKIPEKWKPLIGCSFAISHKCCDVMKKRPAKAFEKKTGLRPMLGTMASDSKFRMQSYLRHSCNAYDLARPRSTPLSIWTHDDICQYVKENDITIPACYDMGYDHTGCMFCMFGVHMEKEPNRFQRMAATHPKQWDYCMNKLGIQEVLDAIGVPSTPTQEVLAL